MTIDRYPSLNLPAPIMVNGYQDRLPDTFTVWTDPDHPDLHAINHHALALGPEKALAIWQQQARDLRFVSSLPWEGEMLEHQNPILSKLAFAAGRLNTIDVANELKYPHVREALQNLGKNSELTPTEETQHLNNPLIEVLDVEGVGQLKTTTHQVGVDVVRVDHRRLASEERAQALIVAMLVAAGERPTQRAWSQAAKSSDPWLLELFVTMGSSIVQNAPSWDNESPLRSAVEQGWPNTPKILEQFVRMGWDLNTPDTFGHGPLQAAVGHGHLENVRWLLTNGAHLFSALEPQTTALHHAAYCGWPHLVPILVEHGMDVNGQDNQGITAFEMAAQEGHFGMVKALLEHGADLSPRVMSNALRLARHTHKDCQRHNASSSRQGLGAQAVISLIEGKVLRKTFEASGMEHLSPGQPRTRL